jgi:hypothetical protein
MGEMMSDWNGSFWRDTNRCQPRFLPFVSNVLGFANVLPVSRRSNQR